jgi:hypothetical protein
MHPKIYISRRLLFFSLIIVAFASILMLSGCGNYEPHPVGLLQQTTNQEAKLEFKVNDTCWVWWEWDIPTNKVPDINVVCEMENLGKNSVWIRMLTEEYLQTGKGEQTDQLELKLGKKATIYSGPLVKMISPKFTSPRGFSKDPTQPLYIFPHQKTTKLVIHLKSTNDFQANPPLNLMLKRELALP